MYYYSHATLPPLPTATPPTPIAAAHSKHQPVLHSPQSSPPGLSSSLSLSSLCNNFLVQWGKHYIIPTQGLWLQSIKYFYRNLQIFCRTIEEKSDLEKTFYSPEVFNIGGDCNIFYLSSVILFPEDGSYIDRWYTNYVFTSSQHHPRPGYDVGLPFIRARFRHFRTGDTLVDQEIRTNFIWWVGPIC